MYFYTKQTPNQNDYVVIKVKTIKETLIECELLEYNNKISYMYIQDLSNQKIRKIQDIKKIIKPNEINVLQVKQTSLQEIILTKKYLNEQEIKDTLQRYNQYRKIFNIINYNYNEDEQLKTQLKTTASEKNYDKIKDLETKLTKQKPQNQQSSQSKLILKTILTTEQLKQNYETCKKKNPQIKIKIQNAKNGEYLLLHTNEDKTEIEQELINQSTQPQQINEIQKQETNHPQPIINIGIIGHVSHGKTTIIKRLTNFDTKKYKEEMQKQKTLKLGYTNAWVKECKCQNEKFPIYEMSKDKLLECGCKMYYISIVDTPGHSELMNTMLCGATIMDTSMMVISSNEQCPQPQTENHLLAATINEKNDNKLFKKSIIIQNKLDLMTQETIKKNTQQIKDFIKETLYENSSIIPISAQYNVNMDYIKKWIYMVSEQQKVQTQGQMKCVIVRTFDINKPGQELKDLKGIILGGSILSGTLNINDEILILPQMITSTVKRITTDNNEISKAHRGGLIGIETDLNPVYGRNDQLIGSIFIKKTDYEQKNLIKKNQIQTYKYVLKEDVKKYYKKKLQTKTQLNLNVGGKTVKNCDIILIQKRLQITFPIQLYIDPQIINKITLLDKEQVIGFVQIEQQDQEKKEIEIQNQDVQLENYINYLKTQETHLREKCYEQIEKIKAQNKTNMIKLPQIKCEYNKTTKCTKIINWRQLMSQIPKHTHIGLTKYLQEELGEKITQKEDGTGQLKKKIDDIQLKTILSKYIIEYLICDYCKKYKQTSTCCQ